MQFRCLAIVMVILPTVGSASSVSKEKLSSADVPESIVIPVQPHINRGTKTCSLRSAAAAAAVQVFYSPAQ